ncbi:MAG: UPF0158 family protein [Pseudomonadota bacterium]
MTVNYSDLEMAIDFVSAGAEYDDAAYLDKESGEIYYDSDSSEDEIPEDVFDNEKYISVPDKKEFGLGKPLALNFAEQYLPNDIENVYSIFRSKGAYSAFKSLLEKSNQLENWYQYEQCAIQEAIVQWCEDNGVELKY